MWFIENRRYKDGVVFEEYVEDFGYSFLKPERISTRIQPSPLLELSRVFYLVTIFSCWWSLLECECSEPKYGREDQEKNDENEEAAINYVHLGFPDIFDNLDRAVCIFLFDLTDHTSIRQLRYKILDVFKDYNIQLPQREE